MEVGGQLHAPAALILGKDLSTHWTEGWVGFRVDLDAMVKTKSLPCSCWELNMSHTAHSLITILTQLPQLQTCTNCSLPCYVIV